jgi:DNA-binding XRE family transcriptional regulator
MIKEAAAITKIELRETISKNVKLLRAEYGYSQQEMANSVGLSKKTLIQVEKERLILSWGATCAVCAVYRNSRQLRLELGEDPINIVETLAHDNLSTVDDFENRNYVFWDVVEEDGQYILAKNIITEHYKITDNQGKKYFASFDHKKIMEQYEKLTNKENSDEK